MNKLKTDPKTQVIYDLMDEIKILKGEKVSMQKRLDDIELTLSKLVSNLRVDQLRAG